jgi:hypothetical protein
LGARGEPSKWFSFSICGHGLGKHPDVNMGKPVETGGQTQFPSRPAFLFSRPLTGESTDTALARDRCGDRDGELSTGKCIGDPLGERSSKSSWPQVSESWLLHASPNSTSRNVFLKFNRTIMKARPRC